MENSKEAMGPKDTKKTLARLLGYLKGYELKVVGSLVALIIGSVSSLGSIMFIKPIVNDYLMPWIGKENPDLSGLFGVILLMLAMGLVSAISSYVSDKLLLPITTGVLYTIRVDMFESMQKLPIRFFDTSSHGDIMSRYTNDTDALREVFGQTFLQLISAVVTTVTIFIFMVVTSWQLTIPIIVALVGMLLIVRFLSSKSGSYFANQQKDIGSTNGYLEEFIEGQNVVKVFNHEEEATKDFAKINEELRKSAVGANTFSNLFMPIMFNLGYMNYAIIAMIGMFFRMDLGTIATFLQLTRTFNQPISQASQQFTFILRGLAAAERIFEIIDHEPELDEGIVTLVNIVDNGKEVAESDKYTGKWAWKQVGENGEVDYLPQQGDILFDHVYFGYTKDQQVIKDISIYANPGQKIALVGSTGAGKTTLTNLLNRFYDIDEGAIYYDGIDIRAIKKDDLRRSLSMVLQDTNLFTGTINDNIRYGNLYAKDEDIVHAATLANADDFINTLPLKYNTHISGMSDNLSQGQRQLLSISRVVVSNPPALILDEATSSIDTRTESLIGQGMDSLMEGRTSFVIAHRLSTIRDADVIMVMENGEIIERGSHDDLVEKGGRYYQLYTGAIELT